MNGTGHVHSPKAQSLNCTAVFHLRLAAAFSMAALRVAAPSPSDLRSSNVVAFSGTCAHTNFGRTGDVLGFSHGCFRFATDSKQWSLEYQEAGGELAWKQSITYDGHALYTLHGNVPESNLPGRVSDLADIALTDTPSVNGSARMPWLAAWSFGLISPPTNNVLPPWARWTEASCYTNRLAPATQSPCASKKTEFVVRVSAAQALNADPTMRMETADLKNDFVEGELVVSACTNLSGLSVPTHAEIRRLLSPERGGRLRSVFVMNTTNAQRIAEVIEKPRIVQRTPVMDWRSTEYSDHWVPMIRPVAYYLSNHWLQTSSPEWQALVRSNALLEPSATADGLIGLRLNFDSYGFAHIQEVWPGWPAQRAGLRAGDLVLSIDGTKTWWAGGPYPNFVGTPGSTAEIVAVRGGQTNVVLVRRVSLKEFLK